MMLSLIPPQPARAAEKKSIAYEYYNIDFDSENDTKNTFVNKAYSGMHFGYWSGGTVYDPVEMHQRLADGRDGRALTLTSPASGGGYTIGSSRTLGEEEYIGSTTIYELSFKFDKAVTGLYMEGAGYIFSVGSDGSLWLGGLERNVFAGARAKDTEILPNVWYDFVIAADNVNKYNKNETRFYAWLNGRRLETDATPSCGCANTVRASYAATYGVQRHMLWYVTPENVSAGLQLDNIRIYRTDEAVTPEDFDGGSVYDKFRRPAEGDLLLYAKSPRAGVGGRTVGGVNPIMRGDNIFVPAEFLADALGKSYSASGISDGAKTVILRADDAYAEVNGSAYALCDAPFYARGKLYVPAADICEIFGVAHRQYENGIFTAGGAAELDFGEKGAHRTLSKALREIIYERTPTPDEVTGAISENNPDRRHPRLLVTPDSVRTLKKDVTSGAPREYMQTVLDNAECFLNMPKIDNSNSLLLYTARDALKRVENLGFAYLMTGRGEYADAAIDVIMTVCSDEFPNWNPQHFLAVAEMSAAVALGYDWCYDKLSDAQKVYIQNALIEKSFIPVMEDYNDAHRSRPYNWSCPYSFAYPNNWIAVCSAGTAMAALAVGDEALDGFDDAGAVISEGIERLKDLQDSYMPDGAMVDGTGYWRYAMTYMTNFIASLESALGTDYTLTNAPGVAMTFDWLMQLSGPAGLYNFDSNDAEFADAPEYRYFARVSGDAKYSALREEQIAEHNLAPTYRDILWYEPPTDVDTSYDRNYLAVGAASTVSLSGGKNRTSSWISMFCHFMDKSVDSMQDFDGSFILDMLGERWALDLGSESGMYASNSIHRKQYYRARAEGHNTVVVAPDSDFDHNPTAHAVKKDFENGAVSAFAIYDFTEQLAFRGVTDWQRGIYLEKQTQCVTVQDELSISAAAPYYWFMHTDAEITLSSDRKSATLSKNGKKIKAYLISDDSSLAFEIRAAAPLATSPNPPQDSNDGVQKLTVYKSAAKNIDMAVRFVPQTGTEPPAADFTPLDDWQLQSVPQAKHAVTIEDSFAPSAAALRYLAAGSVVGISAGTRPGYSFVGWEGDGVKLIRPLSQNAFFEMPDRDVFVKARWEKNVGEGETHKYYDLDFDSPGDTDTLWQNTASDRTFSYLGSMSTPSISDIAPTLVSDGQKGGNSAAFTPNAGGGYFVLGNGEYWDSAEYADKVTYYELTFKFEGALRRMYMEGVGFPFEITAGGDLWIGGLAATSNALHGDRALNVKLLPDRWYRLVVAADNVNKYNKNETRFYAWLNGKPVVTATFSSIGCADVTPAALPAAVDAERQLLLVSNSAPAGARFLLDDIKIYTSDNAVAACPHAAEKSRLCEFSQSGNICKILCSVDAGGEYYFAAAAYNGTALKAVRLVPCAADEYAQLTAEAEISAEPGDGVKCFLLDRDTLAPHASVYIAQ